MVARSSYNFSSQASLKPAEQAVPERKHLSTSGYYDQIVGEAAHFGGPPSQRGDIPGFQHADGGVRAK